MNRRSRGVRFQRQAHETPRNIKALTLQPSQCIDCTPACPYDLVHVYRLPPLKYTPAFARQHGVEVWEWEREWKWKIWEWRPQWHEQWLDEWPPYNNSPRQMVHIEYTASV